MTDDDILARVRAQQLERAWAEFAEDVRSAARLAAQQGKALPTSLPPEAEPWPPMRKAAS